MALGLHLAEKKMLAGRRGLIVEQLRGEPGLAFLELRRRTGIGGGVLTYHLEVLERFGLVASLRAGRCRRYYAAGTVPAAERVAHAMRLTPCYASLLAAVDSSPGATQGVLACALGVSRQTVSYRLRRLAAAGAWNGSRTLPASASQVSQETTAIAQAPLDAAAQEAKAQWGLAADLAPASPEP